VQLLTYITVKAQLPLSWPFLAFSSSQTHLLQLPG
jgi:hypothetical protein